MLLTIALVGRTNVGKSTLFNYLTKGNLALVADVPGLTRDRLYSEAVFAGQKYILVDTAGFADNKDELDTLVLKQTKQAIAEADAILLLVDAKIGLTPQDQMIAKELRSMQKKIYLVANKVEGSDPNIACADFSMLGLGNIYPISALQRQGIAYLLDSVFAEVKTVSQEQPQEEIQGIKIAFIGRPNVGKSTLINRILGEDRLIVYDQPGTTRDSVFIPFQRGKQLYTLIDTAGVRRRRKINQQIEKMSIVRTLQAISSTHVVVFLIDAHESISEQDLHLLDFIISAGKSLVIAINKWDNMQQYEREQVKSELERRLRFIDFARIYFISALQGIGVNHIFKAINEAYNSATKKLSTPILTRVLQRLVTTHQPPMIHGRRVKLRYAHSGGNNPPVIVIHGNQVESLPESYIRYLEKEFRVALRLIGTPIRISGKNSENPYKEKKNVLTPKQIKNRKRIIKHNKK